MRDPRKSLTVPTELFDSGSVNFEWSFIEIRATVLGAKSETKGEHGPEASEAGLRSDRVFRFQKATGAKPNTRQSAQRNSRSGRGK